MSCGCAADWRLELLDLGSGKRLGYLPFVSFSFDDLLNQVGPAQIVANIKSTTMAKILPHLRAVAFTRVAGPGASRTSPVCEYIGIIETVQADSGGSLTIGLQSIEFYLNYRLLFTTGAYTGPQSDLGADVVNVVSTNGIPLAGATDGAGPTRTIDVEPTSDTRVLDFILSLCALDGGPDYTRRHEYGTTGWATYLDFSAVAGEDTEQQLNAASGISSYGLTVEGSQHANWVRGRDQNQAVYAINGVGDSIYPRFDKSVKFSDMVAQTPVATNLENATDGELYNNRDPIAIPNVTVARLAIAAGIGLGDTRVLDMDNGAIRYMGKVRVVGKSWSVGGGQPTLCTLTSVPSGPASAITDSILNAPPRTKRGCC